MAKWLLALPFALLALAMALVGALFASYHLRSRQDQLDLELSQAWQTLGLDLRNAGRFLDQPSDQALDPARLTGAAGDTLLQARLGEIGARLDSICRFESAQGFNSEGLDSLRESVRRDRERLGLSLARYRQERHSLLGRWVLKGFPVR